MRIKKAVVLLLMGILLVALVACDGGSDSANEGENQPTRDVETSGNDTTDGQTLTIWAWDPNYNIIALETAKEIFLRDNPDVHIEIVTMARNDLEQSLSVNLASGTAVGLPDIVLVEHLNAEQYIMSFPGAFEPLNQAVDFSNFAAPVDFMTVDGNTYGLPFGLATAGMFFRRDYFEAAGFNMADLTDITWDEFIDIGLAVQAETGLNILTQDPGDGGLLRMMMQSAGVWFFDDDGQVDVEDNEIFREVLEQYYRLMNSGIVQVAAGWSDFVGAFNGGEVATVPTGVWIIPSIMAEESHYGLWQMAPMPRLNHPQSRNATKLGGSSWFVLSSSDHTDLALDFLAQTFAGSVELYDTLLADYGISSMFVPAFESPAYTAEIGFFANQEVYADVSAWSLDVLGVNYGMFTWEVDNVMMNALPAFLSSGDVDEALSTIQRLAEQQIQ